MKLRIVFCIVDNSRYDLLKGWRTIAVVFEPALDQMSSFFDLQKVFHPGRSLSCNLRDRAVKIRVRHFHKHGQRLRLKLPRQPLDEQRGCLRKFIEHGNTVTESHDRLTSFSIWGLGIDFSPTCSTTLNELQLVS